MFVKLALIMIATVPVSALADAPDPKPEKPLATEPAQMEGIWPSPKLMDLLLRRWAQEVSNRHDLDKARLAKVEQAVVKRWGTFFSENRSQIQPLINEFAELQMEMEPPSKERVQDWARRATPVFDQFRGQIKEGNTEVRELLGPLQAAKFDVEAMAFDAALAGVRGKLEKWENGDFAPREFWMPTPAERRKMHEAKRRERETRERQYAADKPEKAEQDQIALELESWDKYVEEFVRLYGFDESQRTTALSCLSELKQRAIDHRDTRRDDIAKLEERIENHTGSEQDLAEIKKQLSELYGPIDGMFKELKDRLAQIPTAEQRAKVEESDKES